MPTVIAATDWDCYAASAASTATGASNTVWTVWNQLYTAGCSATSITYSNSSIWQTWNVVVQETQAQRDQREAETVCRNAEQRKRTEERAAAKKKAEGLLLSVLEPSQREQFKRERSFDVLTCRSGKTRRYRIKDGWAGNVFLIDETGREVEKFCIHPVNQVPTEDNLIAQKLLLEVDEERFLKIANKTILRAAA